MSRHAKLRDTFQLKKIHNEKLEGLPKFAVILVCGEDSGVWRLEMVREEED